MVKIGGWQQTVIRKTTPTVYNWCQPQRQSTQIHKKNTTTIERRKFKVNGICRQPKTLINNAPGHLKLSKYPIGAKHPIKPKLMKYQSTWHKTRPTPQTPQQKQTVTGNGKTC